MAEVTSGYPFPPTSQPSESDRANLRDKQVQDLIEEGEQIGSDAECARCQHQERRVRKNHHHAWQLTVLSDQISCGLHSSLFIPQKLIDVDQAEYVVSDGDNKERDICR